MQVDNDKPQLVCRLHWDDRNEHAETTGEKSATLIVDWVLGVDRGLFETFTNHLWRKVEAGL